MSDAYLNMDEWMDGWINGSMDHWMNELMVFGVIIIQKRLMDDHQIDLCIGRCWLDKQKME